MKSNSLVLYKNNPALVKSVSDKIEIELQDKSKKRVRSKDLLLIHNGPKNNLNNLDDLTASKENLEDTWELLQEDSVNLSELADLIFAEITPNSCWAAWKLLYENLYFKGDINTIKSRTEDEMQDTLSKIASKANAIQKRKKLLERIKNGELLPDDSKYMREVEQVALGETSASRLMQELNREQLPEKAHSLLLNINIWDNYVNPYPRRFKILNPEEQTPKIPELPDEERRDLTYLRSYAIDDEGCTDPDDALSYEGCFLWVHIADVAAIVTPGSKLDQYALDRASNLYIPEKVIPMLPKRITEILGLGLTEISPALSFKIKLDNDSNAVIEEIVPSWIKVTRLSYKKANEQINNEPLKSIYEIILKFKDKRLRNKAIEINLPEVKIRVKGKDIIFSSILPLASRNMVVNAMLMTGEAIGNFAIKNNICIPFAIQTLKEKIDITSDELSEMFACRKKMKAAILQTSPEKHAGLGLDIYVKATSPLRRYLDLLIHHQLRSYLKDESLMSEEMISAKIAKAQPLSRDIRTVERLSNRHWSLVYLDSVKWKGEAILVDKYGSRGTFIIPELAFETRVSIDRDMELDTKVELAYNEMNLANLTGSFLIVNN